VAEEARHQGHPKVWDVVAQWLGHQPGGRILARTLNTPKLTGALPNKGYVAA